jgi:hypothetical protein
LEDSNTAGTMPAGTLILGIAVDTAECGTCRAKIKIYKSTDNGRNWDYVSTAVQSANSGGLWEPDFSIASDGALVMHYADESSSCCTQKLVRRRSYDGGATWQDHTNTVALSNDNTHPDYPKRPGMPVVSRLGNGDWLMTYEVCGQSPAGINCETRYKTSTDGWNYGATNTIGPKMIGHHGRYSTGTPVNKVLADGTLLWMGHFLRLADGTFSAANGAILFKSPSGDPAGPWEPIPAPATVPDPQAPGCEGFSPGLQWVSGGATLVHMTSRFNSSTNACDMYYGTGPVN